jgi:hypothetical protein
MKLRPGDQILGKRHVTIVVPNLKCKNWTQPIP